MRIDKKAIEQLTHCRRVSSQVAWFRNRLGVEVPHDKHGVILTESSLEKLIEMRLGILAVPSQAIASKPSVRLRKGQT